MSNPNKWLSKEETEIANENRRNREAKDPRFMKIIVLLLFILVVGYIQTLKSVENFSSQIKLSLLSFKEIPGAGWTCDYCGFFQSQGTHCVHCKCPRHKNY